MTAIWSVLPIIPFKALMNTWQNLRKDQTWGIRWRINQENEGLSFGIAVQVRQIIYSSSTCALLRKKEEKRKIQVIFVLTGCLRDTNYTVFFDNFFNRPSFIIKLIGKSLQDIAIARMDRKEIPKIKPDKQVKRGDYEYQFIDKVSCCKWSDRRSVTLLFINIFNMQLK